MKKKTSEILSNRLVDAFLKNKIISPLPPKYTKRLINADKFDALVDYYQMGVQMMIEGILKGYGYDGKMPQNTKEYEWEE